MFALFRGGLRPVALRLESDGLRSRFPSSCYVQGLETESDWEASWPRVILENLHQCNRHHGSVVFRTTNRPQR